MKTHTPQTKATHIEPFTSFIRATFKATRKAGLLIFSVAILLGGGAATVRGQSALDGFDPNANGAIGVAVVQPDGKLLLGGEFTTVLGVTRNHIARLNPDGTLDATFDPNANGNVVSIGVQTDGKVLAGGLFNAIGGQTRNFLARLDAVTGLADSSNFNANNIVDRIAVQANGRILTGGGFTSIGGQTRNGIARLDPVSGLADSWNPNSNGSMNSFVVQADGKILVGNFGSIGGQVRASIAGLDAVTGLPDSHTPTPTPTATATATGTPMTSGPLWYNGDADLVSGLANEDNTSLGSGQFASVYDNFNVTGSGWTVTEAFSNNLENTNVTGATWEIRRGTTLLNTGGTLVASGMTATPVVTPTGRSAFGLTEFQIKVTGLNVSLPILPAGQFYWLNVTPIGDLTGRAYDTATVGANCVGTPCGNDQNAFFNSNFFAVFFGSTANQGQPSDFSMGVNGTTGGGSPTPTQVVSRKLHNGAPFDINLPLTGNSGIECRSGGASNDYQVIATFPSSVTFDVASVTAGAGTVSSSSGSGTNTITVNLTGVTSAQRITVTLLGVNNGTTTGNLDIPMGVLIGDTTGNGTVNASDVAQTKASSGQAVNPSNFRADVNVSGSINAADIALVKSKAGTVLP